MGTVSQGSRTYITSYTVTITYKKNYIVQVDNYNKAVPVKGEIIKNTFTNEQEADMFIVTRLQQLSVDHNVIIKEVKKIETYVDISAYTASANAFQQAHYVPMWDYR